MVYEKRLLVNVTPVAVNNSRGLLHNLKIGIFSRVMVRRNVSVSDGLVNVARSIIIKLKQPGLRRGELKIGELLEAVLIQFYFDDETIGRRVKDSEGFVLITPTFADFKLLKVTETWMDECFH